MRSLKITLLLFLLVFSSGILSAQKKNSKPWFFIQITDPQFGMYENNKGFGKETQLYLAAVAGVNRLKPDFVVITGDLVNDRLDTMQIREFKRITSKITSGVPVYCVPGNHDIGNIPDSATIASFVQNYGSDRFSFNHKNSLFIGLNSEIIKANINTHEQNQYDWLVNALSKGKKSSHIILFGHYSFFISSFDEPDGYFNIGNDKRMKYLELFASNKVNAIFSGHYHKNAVSRFGDIDIVTTSAVGMPHGDVPSGFRVVKVYPDRIEHHFYGLEELPAAITFNK